MEEIMKTIKKILTRTLIALLATSISFAGVFAADNASHADTLATANPKTIAALKNDALNNTAESAATNLAQQPSVESTGEWVQHVGTMKDLEDAIDHDDYEAIMFILGENPSLVNAIDADGNTPLTRAIRECNNEAFYGVLDSGADVNKMDKNGYYPLFLAITYDNTVPLRALLRNMANVNQIDKNGETPLTLAAQYNDADVINILLEYEPNIHETNGGGESPLAVAIIYGALTTMQILLENGARVNQVDFRKNSPLSHAAYAGSPQEAELLINAGAHLEHRDARGQTPLAIAINRASDEIKAHLSSPEKSDREYASCISNYIQAACVLIQYGAELKKSVTDIIFTQEFLNELKKCKQLNDLVNTLIYVGKGFEKIKKSTATTKKTNAKDDAITLYDYALNNGVTSFVNRQDKTGSRPLHYAVRQLDQALIEKLLQNGADKTLKNKDGKTPLALACDNVEFDESFTSIVNLLNGSPDKPAGKKPQTLSDSQQLKSPKKNKKNKRKKEEQQCAQNSSPSDETTQAAAPAIEVTTSDLQTKDAKRTAAAIVIQKLFRGNKSRKEAMLVRQELCDEKKQLEERLKILCHRLNISPSNVPESERWHVATERRSTSPRKRELRKLSLLERFADQDYRITLFNVNPQPIPEELAVSTYVDNIKKRFNLYKLAQEATTELDAYNTPCMKIPESYRNFFNLEQVITKMDLNHLFSQTVDQYSSVYGIYSQGVKERKGNPLVSIPGELWYIKNNRLYLKIGFFQYAIEKGSSGFCVHRCFQETGTGISQALKTVLREYLIQNKDSLIAEKMRAYTPQNTDDIELDNHNKFEQLILNTYQARIASLE